MSRKFKVWCRDKEDSWGRDTYKLDTNEFGVCIWLELYHINNQTKYNKIQVDFAIYKDVKTYPDDYVYWIQEVTE